MNEINTNELMTELNSAITNSTPWANKMALAEDAVNCWWYGQTDDGRKRNRGVDGNDSWPWEGASDTRVRIVQEKCNELLALCNNAYKKGTWSFSGVDGLDFVKAQKMTQLLKWQVKTQMGRECDRQRKLATRWMIIHGLSFLSVCWDKQERLGLTDITSLDIADKMGVGDLWREYAHDIETIYELSEDGDFETIQKIEKVLDLHIMMYSPDDTLSKPVETLASWINYFYPETTIQSAKEAAIQLREDGTTRVAKKRTVRDAPRWEAFLPFSNIFFPIETSSVSSARWFAVRKWYTKTEIQSNSVWSKDFKEKLLQAEGQSSTFAIDTIRSTSTRWRKSSKKLSDFIRSVDRTGLFEVFEFYYKTYDAKNTVECIKRSVYSEFAKDDNGYIVAEEDIYDEGGDYPFLALEENPESDYFIDNTGIPLLIYTHQQEIKEARDGRIDAKDINLLPPIRRNIRDMGRPFAIGPDRPIYESVAGSTEWMSTPNSKTYMAIEVENVVKRDVDRFVGTNNADVPNDIVALLQSERIENYTDIMSNLLSMTFKLDQLYLSEAVVTRVSGILPAPFKVSRDDIAGSYDFAITFDPREMSETFSTQKAEQLVKILGFDKNGIIDTNKAIALVATMLDPDWAEQLITDANSGAQREISDEQNKLALILTGQEPPMIEEVSAKVRLDYLQSVYAQSPEVQNKINSNEFCKSLFMNRIKHLEFTVQQQQNAIIGRVGTNQIIQQ